MASSYFQIDGIEGPSREQNHLHAIPLEEFRFAERLVAGSYTSARAASAGVEMQEFLLTMRSSSATPLLFQACASGKHFRNATLWCKVESGEGIKWTFEDLIITSFSTKGGSEIPAVSLDQISIAFGRIIAEYQAVSERGEVSGVTKAGWDLTKNARL